MNKHRKTKNITAAELTHKLSQDKDFMRHQKRRAEYFATLDAEFARDERPVVDALTESGVPVKSVWDLVNTKRDYRRSIPVLLDHLKRPYPFRIREGIARALTIKDAGQATCNELVNQFRRVSESTDAAQHGFKWALGNAISVVADNSSFNEVAELILDKQHGTSRDMMTLRLPELDSKRAISVLLELLEDNEVASFALIALAKLGAQEARHKIQGLLSHPEPTIRAEARRALAKLNK
jgi:hypothetical protein